MFYGTDKVNDDILSTAAVFAFSSSNILIKHVFMLFVDQKLRSLILDFDDHINKSISDILIS